MSKTDKLTKIRARLATHYLGVINRAVDKSQFRDIDNDWLQIKNMLEHGQVHLTSLDAASQNQQWKTIIDITRSICQTNGYLSVNIE